jgi:hypothetical protein
MLAYALHAQAGTRPTAEAVPMGVVLGLKSLAGQSSKDILLALNELNDSKFIEITRTPNADNAALPAALADVASVRATRALLSYVDGFGL